MNTVEMIDVLLSLGGKEVEIKQDDEYYIISDGMLFNLPVDNLKCVGQNEQMYAACLWKEQGLDIYFGYALLDNTWILHYWGVEESKIIEYTFDEYSKYYGKKLDDQCSENLYSSLFLE